MLDNVDFVHFVIYVFAVVIFPLMIVVFCFFGDYVVLFYRFIKTALTAATFSSYVAWERGYHVTCLQVRSIILFLFQEAKGEIPRWNKAPADEDKGDLDELGDHGSLHQYLLHLHDHGRCPVTSFWWAKTHVVSVCSPKAFEDTQKLYNRPGELYKGFEQLIGPDSIQYANDEDWLQRKKWLYHTIKGEDLKSYFPHFVKIAQETEERWLGYAADQKVSLMKEVISMTIWGICRSCLGDVFEGAEEVERLADCYYKCWREMEERIAHGPPDADSDREKDLQHNLQSLKDMVHRIVQARREGKGREELPFIDALLQSGVPEEQIISDTLTFMVGGFHTSGYFMTWLFWYLAEHPAVQERLVEELEEVVGGECGEKLKQFALSPTTYMRQVQDEVLRVTTLATYAARYSDKDIVVDGYNVSAGTPIIHALGVASKNETQWKDVDRFDPHHFAPYGPHARRGAEFCPFGTNSPRKCPGYQFSYFEVTVFTSILLQRFTLVPVKGQHVEQVYGIVTAPKEEIYLYVRARE